jgi:hypothetical protein
MKRCGGALYRVCDSDTTFWRRQNCGDCKMRGPQELGVEQ